MRFHGEPGYGRASMFTRQQHLDALAWVRAQNGRRGAKTELARRLGITTQATTTLLLRAQCLERGDV